MRSLADHFAAFCLPGQVNVMVRQPVSIHFDLFQSISRRGWSVARQARLDGLLWLNEALLYLLRAGRSSPEKCDKMHLSVESCIAGWSCVLIRRT
jgi:hypothetical protein